jgi:hypothetical protein
VAAEREPIVQVVCLFRNWLCRGDACFLEANVFGLPFYF